MSMVVAIRMIAANATNQVGTSPIRSRIAATERPWVSRSASRLA
jgi:hypothetical protein